METLPEDGFDGWLDYGVGSRVSKTARPSQVQRSPRLSDETSTDFGVLDALDQLDTDE